MTDIIKIVLMAGIWILMDKYMLRDGETVFIVLAVIFIEILNKK